MAGGNYGGLSNPTTPIPGDALYSGRSTSYLNWKCTLMQADAAGDVVIDGLNVYVAAGVQSVINISPNSLTSDPGAGVTFWCYSCSCSGPMSGTTFPDTAFYTGNTINALGEGGPSNRLFRPVIIGGGGGLNS